MKKLWIIIPILIGILFVLGPGKDLAIRSSVMAGSKKILGAEVRMGSFALDLLQQTVRIKDLKVYNPDGFPEDRMMMEVPEIVLRLDVPALFKNVVHVRYMRLNLKEARVIKKETGALNVNALKIAQKKSDKKVAMQFDLVSLTVGRVIFEDYVPGKTEPKVSTYNVNLKDKEFKDVKSAEELAGKVIIAALVPAGLGASFSKELQDVGQTVNSLNGTVSGIFKGFQMK